MRRALKKLVQGLTTAVCAVGSATLAVSVLDSELHWFGWPAALRVGLPAFVAGALFFPVDVKALANRLGFTARALFASAAACAAHRVMLWSARDDLPLLPDFAGGVEDTLWLAVVATGGAAALAFLLQPAMKRLAEGPRPYLKPLEHFDHAVMSDTARLRSR